MRTAIPEPRRGISIRIYSVAPDGARTDLPIAPAPTRISPCGVPGCTCMGDLRDPV